MVNLAAIEGDEIVIRVKISRIPGAVRVAIDDEWGVLAPGAVTDANAFARSLIVQLNQEYEDGMTAVLLMFDHASLAVIDAGTEGFSLTGGADEAAHAGTPQQERAHGPASA